MLTCREATHLASDALDHPLPWTQRFQMRLHMLVCSACRRFAKQLAWMQRAGVEYATRPDHVAADASLSPDAEERIRAALDKELGK